MMINIKRFISDVLSANGIHSMLEHYCLSDKAFILMYHRVMSSHSELPYFVQPGMYVTTDSFEKQIVYLKGKYKVIFLEDLVIKMKKGEEVGGFCAITFDDGWHDNFTDVFKILKKYQVPATIFIATGFVGTENVFWPEEICYCLEKFITSKSNLNDSPSSVNSFIKEISHFRACVREEFFEKSVETLKVYLPDKRDEILEYFKNVYKNEKLPRQMLSWSEIKEMYVSGLINLGAHTENHVILDQVSRESAIDEISKSRLEIERQIGVKVKTFAFPNGNQNKSIRTILSEQGFDAAVTTLKGFVAKNTPLMEIPRIGMHEDVCNTIPMFRSRILFNKF